MHARKLVFAVLSGGLAAGAVVLPAGTASAVPCGTAIAAGSNCTLTGTVSLTGGLLALTSPSSLAWTSTLNGLNQVVLDTNAADQQYTVTDATGTGAGWHVTASATTFTNGTRTFPNTGTFTTNGSTTSSTATTGPSATCPGLTSCIVPTNPTTYPVAITTAATAPTPVTIFDTNVNTGVGQTVIGGSTAANPVSWWINIPANAYAGAYVSTITMSVISAP